MFIFFFIISSDHYARGSRGRHDGLFAVQHDTADGRRSRHVGHLGQTGTDHADLQVSKHEITVSVLRLLKYRANRNNLFEIAFHGKPKKKKNRRKTNSRIN